MRYRYNSVVRSLRRRLFASVSVLSLILCLATVGLWVRSYFAFDALSSARCTLISVSGRCFGVRIASGTPDGTSGFFSSSTSSAPGRQVARRYVDLASGGHWWNRRGFQVVYAAALGEARSLFLISAPHWFVAALLLAPPAYWFYWFRRDRRSTIRSAEGRCRHCGYDLRASPQRCPECGSTAKDEG
jgi:hypothetical protein